MSGLEGRRVAIVGGAGFIGHHLALALVERGAEVAVVDSLQVNNLLSIQSNITDPERRDLYLRMINERLDLLREAGVTLVVQDARDYSALGRILEEIEPQTLVHAAAVAHANRSNKDPFTTFDHSLRTLENALDFSRHSSTVEHFVYFSSSMAYGDFLTPEVEETQPLEPMGIYGALKAAGERIVIAYQQVFGLPYTIVRPSALYGPRCVSGRVGQVFIENALLDRPLVVRNDGGGILDFTYVDDLVAGLLLVVERPEARDEVFNLTHGASRSIEDLAAVVGDLFPGVEIIDESILGDPLMPRRGTLSVNKARRLLGYEPEFPIERGIPEYVAWYREFAGVPA